jgi:hypothetical protein
LAFNREQALKAMFMEGLLSRFIFATKYDGIEHGHQALVCKYFKKTFSVNKIPK